MRILGNCSQCGKSIQETKKTCGATYIVCKQCKTLIHPHCIGEHRLMHNNQNYYVKKLNIKEDISLFSRISNGVRNFISLKKIK
jgi:hypothetical protein